MAPPEWTDNHKMWIHNFFSSEGYFEANYDCDYVIEQVMPKTTWGLSD